jgi:hypothetical protein
MIVNNSMEFDWNNKIQLVMGNTDNIMLSQVFSGYFRLNIISLPATEEFLGMGGGALINLAFNTKVRRGNVFTGLFDYYGRFSGHGSGERCRCLSRYLVAWNNSAVKKGST